MKTKRYKLVQTAMLACLLITGLCPTADAQVLIPPAIPQKPLAPTPGGMATINSAMIECPDYGHTFAAVTVSDFNGTNLFLDFGDGTVTSGPIQVTTGSWALADVTIGDDLSQSGSQYIVVVSYRELIWSPTPYYEIRAKRYVVDDLGGAMNITQFPYTFIGDGDLPKIDIFADETAPIGGLPSLHEVVIAYLDPSNTIQLERRDMTLGLLQNYAVPSSSAGVFGALDVAAIKDMNTGEQIAAVSTISNSNADLEVYENNLTTWSTPPPTLLQNNLIAYYTRIEAFGLYDGSAPFAKWAVTTSNKLRDIMLYTDLTPPFAANPQPGFNSSSHEYPALASGIGPVYGPPNTMGNTQYTYAWGAPLHYQYYSQALDASGNPPAAINDFYVVNNSPCTMVSDPPELITLCNSANSGANLFVAWNEGGRIMYKQTDNTFGYKPTGIEDIKSFASLTVSPNPATDRILIRSAQGAGKLNIINSVGTLVLRQDIKTGEAEVNTSHLSAGNYFLRISGEEGTITRPLVIAR